MVSWELAMELTIPRLDALQASEHLCLPYENEDERASTLVAFFRDGMARHERCLFIGSADDQHDLLARLEAAGVPTERALERGALVLATTGETYLRTGRFDPEDALALMEGLTERALADGFAGLRATGEASAGVPDELWRQLVHYEALLNERLGRRPFVGLCRLHGLHVSPDRVRDMLRTHPRVLVRGEVCGNPFYERAAIALGDDSRARLDWQLHQLRAYNRARKGQEGRAGARFLSVLADELADPLFGLKREVLALGAALDETPSAERLEAATGHLRRLSAAVEHAREVARHLDRDVAAPSHEASEALDDGSDEARDVLSASRPRG